MKPSKNSRDYGSDDENSYDSGYGKGFGSFGNFGQGQQSQRGNSSASYHQPDPNQYFYNEWEQQPQQQQQEFAEDDDEDNSDDE